MYAILEIGGRQYQVSVGQKIRVNRMAGTKNDEVSLKDVRLLRDEDGVRIGENALSDTSVRAVITDVLRGPKIRVFKTKRRTGFQKTRGHRQDLTELLITDILDGTVSLNTEAAPKAEAPVGLEKTEEGAPETGTADSETDKGEDN
jgi:large subunit ribosomal protein L21